MKKILFLFGELNDDDLDWIIGTGKIEQIPTGTVLIQEGEPLDYLYLLLEGTMTVSVSVFDTTQEIAILGSGEVFGEMSFIDNSLPSATVETIDDSLVLSIPRQKLANRLYQDIGFSSRFYRAIALFLSTRLRTLLKEWEVEKEYLAPQTVHKEDFPSSFLDNLPLAQIRFDWLLQRVKNLEQEINES
ncbi:cyclic nucleotide-binding domain-containing protein [Aphanothece sacrum]|uniref:Cyclic nucleotide-binding protein n=1 Tax=Aphanothece sacrum FPU1 TaxID=1920663 RepID=A0A401ID64_APHSA|nr:cyclic nucleotide-binding domain-containing protein [Aphanothece sacrum]GBF79228.1 cyclic nucleotide-binding protein [Aphanothece sacrum FPU1]GBF84165.1 cyclic nucleotide-binding domain protein [Aphanothece sacrum FPU3]